MVTGAHGVTLQDRVRNIFDRLAWITRYSQGGLRYHEAKRLDGWELRMYAEALDRLVAAENKRDPSGPDRPDGEDDQIDGPED